MLNVINVVIFSADEEDGLVSIEGEAVFEGEIEMPFFASLYDGDDEFEEITLEDDLVEDYNAIMLEEKIFQSLKEFQAE